MTDNNAIPARTLSEHKIPFRRVLLDYNTITKEILHYPFTGSGTKDDPFAVT